MSLLAASPASAVAQDEPRPLLDRLVLAYAAFWTVFLIGGFRMPWEPIPLDEDATFSSRRQLVFTLGALLGVHRLVTRGRLAARVHNHLPWLALAAFLCGSLLWSSDKVLTVKRSLVHLFGVATLIATVDTHERPVRFLLRTTTFALGVSAWVCLLQERVYSAPCWSIPWRQGLCGLSGHPNVLGPCMQMGLMMSLGVRPESFRDAATLRTLQAGLAIALWRTDSMTSITSTVIGVGLWTALRASSYRAGLIQITVVFFGAVALLVGADEVRTQFFAATGRDESLSGRDELWRLVFAETRDRPLLGTGFGAFWYLNRGIELVLTWNPKQAHHSWIDVIAETGYLGLFAVIAAVPLRLVPWWQRCAGPRGSAQRDAVAAILASTVVLLGLAAFSESFLLRMDKIQWFVTIWALMLLENAGPNRIEREFAPG